MCGNDNCNCNISYEVLTRATNVKNFSEAYTLSNDWHLEDRVFYNNNDQLVSEPPVFLSNHNLCGVFDLSAKITIKNNSNQDITNPQIILPTIFSNYITVNENDFYYYVYENQNFLILFQHTSILNAQNPNITVYSQESDGEIYYNGELSNIDDGILPLNSSLKAKMSCIINFNIHVYVKNHSNDFSFTTLFYGLVGSAKKCSCCCLKQTKLPIVDNSVIELDYDSDCC
jgi:hypothetical protein